MSRREWVVFFAGMLTINAALVALAILAWS